MSPGYRIKKLRDGYKPEKILQENIMTDKLSENRKNNHQLMESSIRGCRNAFSGLEKHLTNDLESYTNAEKKFIELKKFAEEKNYTLDMIDYGRYIENNLSGLRSRISSYKIVQSTPSKVGTILTTAILGGF